MSRRKPLYERQTEAAAAEAAAESAKKTAEQEPARHRILADISRQAPHEFWEAVPLVYEDYPFTCVDCGREEVWTAEQQKWWYETAQGHIRSKATRCRACRKALREKHAGTPRHANRNGGKSDGEA